MSWNKPSSAHPPPKKKSAPPSLRRGLIAGLVIIALGALGLYLFSNGEATSSSLQKTDRGRIKEVTPAAAPTNAAPVVKTRKEIDEDFIRKVTERYGTNMPPGLKAYVHHLKNPPKHKVKAMRRFPFLQHSSERSIADLLSAEPGEFFLVQPEYGATFDQDFANALVDKIEIKDEDGAETRSVKEFVTNAKKEIAELVRAEGKKPSELMNEHAKLMFELGRFEDNLARELQQARENPDLTDDDVKAMFDAANVLRQKKGLPERKVPSLTRRSLQMERYRERAEKKTRREAEKKGENAK